MVLCGACGVPSAPAAATAPASITAVSMSAVGPTAALETTGHPSHGDVDAGGAPPDDTATTVSFTTHSHPTLADVDYPADWRVVAESDDLLLLAGPGLDGGAVADGGASFLVRRVSGSVGTGPLDGVLADHLQRDVVPRGYQVSSPPAAARIGGLDGLAVTLDNDGRDGAGGFVSPAMRTRVAAARSAAGTAFVVAAAAEREAWDRWAVVFDRMMERLVFH